MHMGISLLIPLRHRGAVPRTVPFVIDEASGRLVGNHSGRVASNGHARLGILDDDGACADSHAVAYDDVLHNTRVGPDIHLVAQFSRFMVCRPNVDTLAEIAVITNACGAIYRQRTAVSYEQSVAHMHMARYFHISLICLSYILKSCPPPKLSDCYIE